MGNLSRKKKKNKKEKQKEKTKNNLIDLQMDQENEKIQKTIKIITLGTGESGKSTFLKQLSILYSTGFEESSRELYATTIQNNLIHYLKILLRAAHSLGIKIQEENTRLSRSFFAFDDLTTQSLKAIIQLWSDPGLKQAYERRSEFQLPDMSKYFLDDAERIGKSDYLPTDQDILNCRIPTTGVNELNIVVDDLPWIVVDVGGQRSERRKWIHHFDGVTLVVYVVALSEYDQQLFEDQTVNRMLESLDLFAKTINNECFENKNCVVLFNKDDIFRKKIKEVPLKKCFPNFTGENDYQSTCKFIQEKFDKIGRNKKRVIFYHFTCATDTESMRAVFDIVSTTILQNQLNVGGYL
ncbi:guanine nucleotide-binding protein g(o) subunit alpha [Anaeramoeba flamelloides]|uniref:Guanine nucleotide-binding protein g(O) subunit alpha n=1 Tax=Anaeramoeba flamelloides TaxID=1746091 RepID=A0ABQ8Y522_9EUKA|nr:guanine nucleotide-binding protein g(o) subunit alpha [Anaeramoeba flamelloides]